MRITARITISRPAEAVFWLSQDYGRRLEWDTYLTEAHLVGDLALPGVGTESYCRSRGGAVMVSRYISFAPPSHAAVTMVQGPWILRTFGGTWRFHTLPDGGTEVRFIYHFTVRPTVLRWLVEPIVAAVYRRDMRSRLGAFKDWAERPREHAPDRVENAA
jgi:hypothetical protein